ncbi:hypothetical protein [uncultured Sulfitobacter sp.]|uniref:hypothetical protein n=1 Tax=uncultured Sulfitobacter sp. TaxID=191468 RepID=UPI0025935098|nr:hypothetical protein [uncultured Sulfitobacter sp.]
MPMRTYTIASSHAEPETRKAHIITFSRAGQPPVDVAIYKAHGGYQVDHPRSGYAMKVFDQVSRFGSPVSFADAKSSLEIMLDQMDGYEKIREAAARLPVLNEAFN